VALRHWDGFTAYSELADLDHLYTREGLNTNIAVLPNGGPQELGSVRLGGANLTSAGFYRTITSSSTIVMGWWMRWDAFNTSAGNVYDEIMEIGAGASAQLSMRLYSDGSLRVYQSSTLLFDSLDTDFSPDGATIHYLITGIEYRIEMRAVISATVGELEIRVNDVLWCLFTAANTGSSNITRVTFHTGSSGAGANLEVSEVYVFDGTGTFNTTFLTSWRAQLLRPTSDDSVAFTRNTGAANFETVDDVIQDSDSTHNASTANAQIDRFATTGTLGGPTTMRVQAINVVNIARRESAAQNMRNKIRHGGVDGNGASFALPSAEDFRPVIQSFETNPSTSAQWTKTEAQAATFGYESLA
jgi:hypothetical protein